MKLPPPSTTQLSVRGRAAISGARPIDLPTAAQFESTFLPRRQQRTNGLGTAYGGAGLEIHRANLDRQLAAEILRTRRGQMQMVGEFARPINPVGCIQIRRVLCLNQFAQMIP